MEKIIKILIQKVTLNQTCSSNMKKILKNTYIYKMSKKKIIGRNVLYILYSGELKD